MQALSQNEAYQQTPYVERTGQIDPSQKKKNLALLVFGPFADCEKSKKRRLYEQARCTLLLYMGLRKCQFSKEHIRLIDERPPIETYTYYNKHSSVEVENYSRLPKERGGSSVLIENALAELETQAERGDVLWIFFLGHGGENGLYLKLPEAEQPSVLLSPSFFKERLNIAGLHYNLVIDACYSGIFLPLTSSTTTVFTSAQSNDVSYSLRLGRAERYAMQFVRSMVREPKHSLFLHHIAALDENSPGCYESLSHFLDHHLEAEEEEVVSKIVDYIILINSGYKKTICSALAVGAELFFKRPEGRYGDLENKLYAFLQKSDLNAIKQFGEIATPLFQPYC